MEIANINWRKDRITREFVEENEDRLREPDNMTPEELCEAITYCHTIENPYTDMLIFKAGMSERRSRSGGIKELSKLLDQSASAFGIKMY